MLANMHINTFRPYLLTTVSMKPFTDQFALTVIAPVASSGVAYLKQLLDTIQFKIETNPVIPFGKFEGLHFARFVLIEAGRDALGNRYPAELIYSGNFDVSLEDHISQMTKPELCGGFAQVFGCCQGFNKDAPAPDAVRAFVLQHRHPVHTFYRGHRGLSVAQIRQENTIRNLIQDYLNTQPSLDLPVQTLKQAIADEIKQRMPDWHPPEPVKLPWRSFGQTVFLFVLLPLILLLVVSVCISIYAVGLVVIALAGSAAYLRHLEKTAVQIGDDDENFDRIKDLAANEDKIVQNQLTHLVSLQPGLFRRSLQCIALFALDRLALYTFNKGRLGDIATIHFARWSMIDGGKRLLFFSNFDGSWENYLGDFVDRAALGLTLAWSNTYEFPRTKWLVTEGATDEERFKTWTRKYQIQTAVWYSGYRDLTVKNILRNRSIATGIYRPMTDDQVIEWLQLL